MVRKLCIYWTKYTVKGLFTVDQFGVINSCIRACFWLHCNLFHAASTNICTKPIFNDPVVVTVDGKKGRQRW